MKHRWTIFAALLTAFFTWGCKHSTNEQVPLVQNDFTILSPSHESMVQGEVTVSVGIERFEPILMEFSLNGEIFATQKGTPWQAGFSTSGLATNSRHTLRVSAYYNTKPFIVTKEVVVRTQ